MLRRTITLFALAATVALALRPAAADEESKRDKVREKVRTMIMAKIIEALDLDDATSQKLFPVLDKFHDQAEALAKDSGQARRELKQMIDSGKTDDAKINKLVDRLVANRAKASQLEADLFKDVRKILTPVQAAKLVVILPRIKDRMERRIRRAAEGRGGRGARGDGGGGAGDDDDGGDWRDD